MMILYHSAESFSAISGKSSLVTQILSAFFVPSGSKRFASASKSSGSAIRMFSRKYDSKETVCLPNGAPLCEQCPIKNECIAYQKELTDEIPVRIKALKRKTAKKTVFLITADDGRIAIEKRPEKGRLSGLYQLPNMDGYYSNKELYNILRDWGMHAQAIAFHKEAKHGFTHIDWYMKAYRVTVATPNDRFLWVTEEELNTAYSLPTAFRKLLK